MNITGATVHIDTEDVTVELFCEHSNGEASIEIQHGNNKVRVYLVGTVDELGTFAGNLAKVVAEWAVAQVERATA